MRKFKETKEELKETRGEKFKKKLFFKKIELNLFLAGYPVYGKIIGRISGGRISGSRISGQISIRCNPTIKIVHNLFISYLF